MNGRPVPSVWEIVTSVRGNETIVEMMSGDTYIQVGLTKYDTGQGIEALAHHYGLTPDVKVRIPGGVEG